MSNFLVPSNIHNGKAGSLSLKTLSITQSSALVVLEPQKAVQSFTVMPGAIAWLPRLTVPGSKGTSRAAESSSKPSLEA